MTSENRPAIRLLIPAPIRALIPALAVAALAGPALAQSPVTQSPVAQSLVTQAPAAQAPAARSAQPLSVAGPSHDPEVEVAFWESVKDSGDPMLYLAYLENFPDGAFRVIARNRLEALWERALLAFDLLDRMGVALDDPAPGSLPGAAPGATPGWATPGPAATPAPPPSSAPTTPKPPRNPPSWQLVRNTQNQLRAHGCYHGAVDGIWGTGSERAMRRFNRWAGTTWSVQRPTTKALKSMRSLTKSGVRICR